MSIAAVVTQIGIERIVTKICKLPNDVVNFRIDVVNYVLFELANLIFLDTLAFEFQAECGLDIAMALFF